MLEVHHLQKSYHSKSGVTVKALDDISLKLPAKGMVFILGKSGSGKSTLLNVLGGLDGFDSGEFYVKGKQINSFRQSDFDSYRNTYVGFIFQEYNIIDDFTVGQNIALAMQIQGKKPNSDDINNILKEVDLDGLGDRKPNELSGGQKQRVAIARALIKKPQIIMADEPTGALDSNTGIQIFDTLKKLSSDKLVLIVSHDREFSERYADRIIEIKDGKVISDMENTAKGKAVKQEGITCAGDTVIVRQDYVLKQSDLKTINDFLKKCKNGAKIKTGAGLSSKSTFRETNQSNIQMDNSGFQLIKSTLPINYAFKMGMKGLGHKKFKLIMTIFLSVVSFGMLGMSTSMMFFNERSAMIDTFYSSEINFASFRNRVSNNNHGYSPMPMSRDQFNEIKGTLGENAKYIVTGGDFGNPHWSNNITIYPNPQIYHTNFTGLTSIDSPTDLADKFGFTYEKEGGQKVPGENEIIISAYVAECLVKEGYKETEDTSKNSVTRIDDLIGKTLNLDLGFSQERSSENYKIVNIVNTGFDLLDPKYDQIVSTENPYMDSHWSEFSSYVECSLASVLFVNKDTINLYEKAHPSTLDSWSGNFAIFNLPHNKQEIAKIVDYSFNKRELTAEEKEFFPEMNYVQCGLGDELSNRVSNMATSLSTLKNVFLYIGLAFIVFSGLLLANFIANSISYQKKEIGILRAIGSRSKDVFKIYYSESLVIALINFVIASAAAWAIVTFAIGPSFTGMLGGITLFSFGIIPVLIILGVALVSSFLATLIPVYRTAKKKPIEAIRNK